MNDGQIVPDYRDTLYDPKLEHDSCGVGFVANINGKASHDVVCKAVQSVINVTHRGAIGGDAKTGDGAGIITQIPRKLFGRELATLGISLPNIRDLAVGMVFLPRKDYESNAACRRWLEQAASRQELKVLGWRSVPVDKDALGDKALETRPDIQQLLLAPIEPMAGDQYERRLFLARKEAEAHARAAGITDFYVPSMSHRTIVYKGLFVAPQLPAFYLDLTDPEFESSLALFHQRYSTNTFPTWHLAQPFRMLGHNGEINTLQGNFNWTRAREPEMASAVWGDQTGKIRPIIQPGGSDSANLDNVLETISLSGRDVLHTMLMLVPEAWENMPDMEPARRAFYEYHACLMEPWDGPAALAFTDGLTVGAVLDRNGLRPARYKITADGLVVMGSEVGIVDLPDEEIVEKGRLGPGSMIAVDTVERQLLRNDEIKARYSKRRPYADWLDRQVVRLDQSLKLGSEALSNGRIDPAELGRLQRSYSLTNEELKFVLEPMDLEGKEPIWSMGDDTPLPILSSQPRSLHHFFKQRFAQVTNPPIDPLREQLVMSLDSYLGRRGNLLTETEKHARILHIENPILLDGELEELRGLGEDFRPVTLSTLMDSKDGTGGLETALESLCRRAEESTSAGSTILILSDRGIDSELAAIPMILAAGAVHHHLIRAGKRMRADIIAETGQVWDVHHIAVLIGYGVSAVNPYLALETIRALVERQVDDDRITLGDAIYNYRKATSEGLLKIISKMGISTLSGYRGAQIFEAIGIDQDVIDRYFTDTPSRVRGIGLGEIAEDVLARHEEAFRANLAGRLPDYGFYRFRRQGEYHGFNPRNVRTLQKAAQTGDYEIYKQYSEAVNGREPANLRDLLEFVAQEPIPVEEVESIESIRRRFTTQAMSLGALSPEAHQAISVAMNRIGARSNTGEGGEDPSWYQALDSGDSRNNKTKQVASARFGVTTDYLVHAAELEIKMAQGSKPGEGGQLPAHKVSKMIARFRHAIPGIPLISPPPHHDIYSIEDLAQLIYDLKQANPRAKVGVKLVAESGVGTIAAGVAKAHADYILISGQDGGTGASPLSSIKGAGCPWEIGLSETQQVLVLNDLRGRVILRTDGGMKTGRDVVIAAMLGAEEFGFGTASVVAIGCDMARQCHLNTCPTGIATQREDLRAKFTGKPEMLINYLTLVAREVRELLAELGYRSLEEVVGQVHLLRQIPRDHTRSNQLDLKQVLADVDPSKARPHRCQQPRNDQPDNPLDLKIIDDVQLALDEKLPVSRSYAIRNNNRTVGGRLAGEVARRYGSRGLPDGLIDLSFAGSAGQSFGAWCTEGMRLKLVGEANDYVGKGMSGGEIVVHPPASARFSWSQNTIVGNTVLYGATGGRLFAAGRAGERFGVRNSGARAVVEGVGDHACEYMTAGVVVVLGPTGRNFGAGMSAGLAYVLDENNLFEGRYNPELISLESVSPGEDELLLEMITAHFEATGSQQAKLILDDWPTYLSKFWRVAPHPPVVSTEGREATVRIIKQHSVSRAANGKNSKQAGLDVDGNGAHIDGARSGAGQAEQTTSRR